MADANKASRTIAGKPRADRGRYRVSLQARLLGWRVGVSVMARTTPLERYRNNRHHGPHRSADDDHRAHSSTTPGGPTKSARSRRHRDNGLDGAGSRSAESRSPPQRPLLLGRTTRINIIDRRPCRLHDPRSSVACVCSTARSPCSTRSPVWNRNRRPYGAKPTSTGSTDLLCQQDGRIGADFPRCIAMIDADSAPSRAVLQFPSGLRATFLGIVDPSVSRGQMARRDLGRRIRHR